MNNKIRVYICGKLRSHSLGYIKNLSRMIKEAEMVRKSGFAVFIPGLDILQAIYSGDCNFKELFGNSIEWLKVSDAVYVISNWRTSKGVKAEIKLAKKLGIPVFYNLKDLSEYKNKPKKDNFDYHFGYY